MRHAPKLIPLFLLFLVPASFAQAVTARFYPERQEYVVGEPIVIVLEVKNGTSHEVEMVEDGCDWMDPTEFEVTNAPIVSKVSLFGCAPPDLTAVDCLIGAQEIRAGKTLRKKFLLNEPDDTQFDVSSPGTYHLIVKKKVTIDGQGGFDDVIATIDAENEFDILVREPADGELQSRYAPYLKELSSPDIETQELAAQALTQNPPKFLEPVILSMAETRKDDVRFPSVNGLKRLATPAARAKLIDLASGSDSVEDEGLAQQAIPALGEIANPDDCSAILRIATHAKQYAQNEAYIAAGSICREKAIPTLTSVLARDEELTDSIATALGNTGSRGAVLPLISQLTSPDEWVRTYAESALFTLTHRTMQDVSTPAAAAQVSSDWRNWWFMNSESATIYGPDECPATSQPSVSPPTEIN